MQFVDFETFNGNDFLGFDPFGGQKGNLIPRFSKIPNIRIVFPQKFILKGILYFLTSLNQTLKVATRFWAFAYGGSFLGTHWMYNPKARKAIYNDIHQVALCVAHIGHIGIYPTEFWW